MPSQTRELDTALVRALEAADVVLHAGDFTNEEALKLFQGFPRFAAVRGNMDSAGVRLRLRELEILELAGLRIGLTHGSGAPRGMPEALRRRLDGERLDVIVFGHSHRAHNKAIDGVLLFNPGSPTDRVFAPYRSYGILTIADGSVEGRIVKLDAQENARDG